MLENDEDKKSEVKVKDRVAEVCEANILQGKRKRIQASLECVEGDEDPETDDSERSNSENDPSYVPSSESEGVETDGEGEEEGEGEDEGDEGDEGADVGE